MTEEKKIKISNKIYPIYYGLSADLIFFVAINTIFLTNIKNLSAAQINSLTTFSVLIMLIFNKIILTFIRKIGHINSIRLGNFLLLISAILFTFGNGYFLILLAQILYVNAFLFKSMDSVVLRKNLKYQNRLNEYIHYQNKSTLIYSFVTMIISFISGFLYNMNPYLPMIICILFCINNFILSFFIYEVKKEEAKQISNEKFNFTKTILFILLLYAFLYTAIEIGQVNTKLFLQYNMSEFLEPSKVVISLSIILSISRIVRTISDFFFDKIYEKINDKLPLIVNTLLIIAFILVLLGNLIGRGYIGISIMSIGFFIFLGLRDPLENYCRTILLNHCREKNHEKAIFYFTISRKLGSLIVSMIVTCILLKFHIEYAIFFLFLVAVFNLYLIKKVYQLVRR